MKIRIDFDFGIGVDGNGVALDPYAVAMALPQITAEAAHLAGGCNLIRREGTRIEGGALVREPGCTLVIIMSDASEAGMMAATLTNQIKQLLHQRAIMVTATEVSSNVV